MLIDLTEGFQLSVGTHPPAGTGQYLFEALEVTWLLTCVAYVVCEPVIGAVTFPVGLALARSAGYISYLDEKDMLLGGNSFRVFVIIHLSAWVAQFYGHFHYECKYIFLISAHKTNFIDSLYFRTCSGTLYEPSLRVDGSILRSC